MRLLAASAFSGLGIKRQTVTTGFRQERGRGRSSFAALLVGVVLNFELWLEIAARLLIEVSFLEAVVRNRLVVNHHIAHIGSRGVPMPKLAMIAATALQAICASPSSSACGCRGPRSG